MRRNLQTTPLRIFLLLVGVGLVVAGCGSAPLPKVAFFADGTTKSTGPTQYCDTQLTNCTADSQAGVVLRVPPNRPVQISLPDEVSGGVWQVVFKYRTPAGQEIQDRSRIFRPGDQLAYTLVLPKADDQLETAEVQRFSSVITQQADGQLGFPISATWVLSVDDRG